MMKQIMNEWKSFLWEEENIRLPDHTCDITIKTGKLIDLLEDNKKIRSLRVPGWTMQTKIYMHPQPKDVASVAYCNNKPIAIVALTDEMVSNAKTGKKLYLTTGLLNFYVDSWHRGMGLADKLFLNVMEHSQHWKYFISSRGGRKITEKHGYKVAPGRYCNYENCSVYENKNYPLKAPRIDLVKT